jgi:hypothetical protein
MKSGEIRMKISRIMAFRHRTANRERQTLIFHLKNRLNKP